MDIFIFNINDYTSIEKNILTKYKKKEIKNEKTKFTHCLSYFLLEKMLKENYNINTPEITFVNKKPILKTKEKHFSISHSKEYITIAFSDNNCGVDIEQIKPRDYEKIAEKMDFKVNSLIDFYEKWTEYEAIYKLNSIKKSIKKYKFKNYMLTCVSENPNEEYNFYNN